jgi:hypothetical protein
MVNNAVPVPFWAFGYLCRTLSQSLAPPQVSAPHQMRALSSIQLIRCGRSCDIHKKLWVSLWIAAVKSCPSLPDAA